MIIVFKLTIFNYFVFLNREIHLKTLLTACVNYKIKLKQSNFERNAKKSLAFECFSSQIHDILDKKLPLNHSRIIFSRRSSYNVDKIDEVCFISVILFQRSWLQITWNYIVLEQDKSTTLIGWRVSSSFDRNTGWALVSKSWCMYCITLHVYYRICFNELCYCNSVSNNFWINE
jgi:hypothetical protein